MAHKKRHGASYAKRAIAKRTPAGERAIGFARGRGIAGMDNRGARKAAVRKNYFALPRLT
jgi:hypothetical protein